MKIKNWMTALAVLAVSSPAMAEETLAVAGSTGDSGKFYAAAIAIAVAAFGGAIGQGLAASAALQGISRNPSANLLVPMIIGLALIESLVIYGFVIAFQILG